MNFSLLFTSPLFRLFFGAVRPPGRRLFACSASDMAFFGTFAYSAPAQRNGRHNRPGYSVFLATFSTFFASASSTFRACELFSAEFCTFSRFLEFSHFSRNSAFSPDSCFLASFGAFLTFRAFRNPVRISSLFRKLAILTIDFQLFSAPRRPKSHPFFVIFTEKRSFALYAGVHAAGMRSKSLYACDVMSRRCAKVKFP